MIVDRLTISRQGLPPSYHSAEGQKLADFLVHTEFGADVWKYIIEAGFQESRTFSLEFPAGQAIAGYR